jgi:hypothetical protein
MSHAVRAFAFAFLAATLVTVALLVVLPRPV